MSWFFEPLAPFCADIIVVDPPTTFTLHSAKGETKSAQAHYRCMTDKEIIDLPVGQLVGMDAWLFLWATGAKLPFSLACLERWGFVYVTELIWRKTTVNGKPAMGPGYVARTLHEPVIVAKIGAPAYHKPMPSMFEGVRREHSRKPDEFYRLIDNRFSCTHQRKLDVFSRQSRLGWMTWGNEAGKFDSKAA